MYQLFRVGNLFLKLGVFMRRGVWGPFFMLNAAIKCFHGLYFVKYNVLCICWKTVPGACRLHPDCSLWTLWDKWWGVSQSALHEEAKTLVPGVAKAAVKAHIAPTMNCAVFWCCLSLKLLCSIQVWTSLLIWKLAGASLCIYCIIWN